MLKSNVKITCKAYNGNSRTKAFIDLTLDDTLVIKGLTLVEGKDGLFLSFPSTKGKDGNYYNSIYSLDKEWSKLLQDACVKKYNDCNQSLQPATSGGGFQ
jgi:stage V sporulation protein G|nr:MAG TPA_asm: SpoVG [Caudoviricetes sp.]